MRRWAKTTDPRQCDKLIFVSTADDGSTWVSEKDFDAAVASIERLCKLLIEGTIADYERAAVEESGDSLVERLKELGGFTPEISKSLGWDR